MGGSNVHRLSRCFHLWSPRTYQRLPWNAVRYLFCFIKFSLFMPQIFRLSIGEPSYRLVPAFISMGVILERFGVAHDCTFTTLIATQDSNIASGLAMAISTFSLTENGTLEAGPLYALEKTPKAFDIPFGCLRHTIAGPEGDNIVITKEQNQRQGRSMQRI